MRLPICVASVVASLPVKPVASITHAIEVSLSGFACRYETTWST